MHVGGVVAARPDDTEIDAVARERDVAEEGADQRGSMTTADEVGLADEEIDPDRWSTDRDLRRVLRVVIDAVALDVADRPAVETYEEVIRRIFAAHGQTALRDRLVRIRRCRHIVVPRANVRQEQPGAHALEVVLEQRRERVLGRG